MGEKKIEPPKVVSDVREIPPPIRAALFELIAWTVNGGSPLQVFSLGELQHEGQPLGDWEVRIQRLDQ